jgi:hypothetical protein
MFILKNKTWLIIFYTKIQKDKFICVSNSCYHNENITKIENKVSKRFITGLKYVMPIISRYDIVLRYKSSTNVIIL